MDLDFSWWLNFIELIVMLPVIMWLIIRMKSFETSMFDMEEAFRDHKVSIRNLQNDLERHKNELDKYKNAHKDCVKKSEFSSQMQSVMSLFKKEDHDLEQ